MLTDLPAELVAQHLTIGRLIVLLQEQPANNKVLFRLADVGPVLADAHSYRGHNRELAIPAAGDYSPSVGEMIDTLEGIIGTTFEGWKGGDFLMTADTPVWCASRGNSLGSMLIGVTTEGNFTFLETAPVSLGRLAL